MAKINSCFQDLKREYIFPIIERKTDELKQNHPNASIINLGIGDIALPLASSIAKAICQGVLEMQEKTSMKGYGPSDGYQFLKTAIKENEYKHLNIGADEIFISDGANTDTASIQELFCQSSIVAITDPTYPVYFDSNIIAGRLKNILFLPCTKESRFVPLPPKEKCDLVYLCTPNNPTGVALNKEELKAWVDYAKAHDAILLVDNAYAAFITSSDVPSSIYEIPGATDVAIEFKSFSKSAGFTGLRCAYAVVPKGVFAYFEDKKISIHSLWKKRQSIKSNGVSYPMQKGAEAVYTKEGQKETKSQVVSYLEQGQILLHGLKTLGHTCYGGTDSPYIWWQIPKGLTSWQFFDILLEKCHIISIPGSGFGKSGEGFLRLSTFTTKDKAEEALKRIASLNL